MTEAPDPYPDFPDDDESPESEGTGIEGSLRQIADVEPRTGDERVDAVLDSLQRLDELPVGEHAPVFEHAHERLRQALDPDRESA
jgi:hypothetical protein